MFPKASLTGRVVRTNNTMRMAKSWGIMAAARCRRHMSDNPVHRADDRLDNVELGRRPMATMGARLADAAQWRVGKGEIASNGDLAGPPATAGRDGAFAPLSISATPILPAVEVAHVRIGSRAAMAGRRMAQPVYPQHRK